jgi:hypothetical protein
LPFSACVPSHPGAAGGAEGGTWAVAFTRLNEGDQNGFGFGGRVTFNPHENVGLEAQISYYPDAAADLDIADVNVDANILTCS